MDWASFAANKLMACGAKNEADGIQKIAAALRKAKADGMREGLIAMDNAIAETTPQLAHEAKLLRNMLTNDAAKIEKGQE